ncbi:MAG: Fis family transcriptional regulator [Methylotenera sp. RIFCSPLOWO2_02_FULL_45_14]|nr:MAG: Fis family transcriptional regulator [Methylotenera sp. RIFCSPLOWO2_02_FULL_45_14]
MSENCKLSQAVTESLDDYFKHLDGEPPHAIYDMVLGCVEKPLLQYIMHKVGGNQSKAAEILNINRNTLRKKLQQYSVE